jgi:hypothetical protein
MPGWSISRKGQYLSFTDDPAKGTAVDVNGASGVAIEGWTSRMPLLDSARPGTAERRSQVRAARRQCE